MTPQSPRDGADAPDAAPAKGATDAASGQEPRTVPVEPPRPASGSGPGLSRALAGRLGAEVRRLDRQFSWIRRRYPRLGAVVQRVSRPGWALARVPVGLFFVIGGLLAILPVFGLWMIPLGLLLLAVDVPQLRRPVAAAVIRLRRRAELMRSKRRGRAPSEE